MAASRGEPGGTVRARQAVSAVLALAVAGCIRTPWSEQRDTARALTPHAVGPQGAARVVDRRLRIRVLLGADYAAETVRAEERARAVVQRANAVLERQFGVSLDVVEVRPWPREVKERALQEALDELVAAEPGAGVAWVIGFVGSSGQVSRSADQLGIAHLLGKHLVLRKMSNSEEREVIQEALDLLGEAEQEKVLRERVAHRETSVLLHEWAHALGAPHELESDTIMSMAWSQQATSFSPRAARIVELGLGVVGSAEPAVLSAWARDYRAALEEGRAAWERGAVEQLGPLAEQVAAARAARPRASAPEPSSVPRPAAAGPVGPGAALVKAEANARLGDLATAWALVEPVARAHEDVTWLQVYACHLGRRAAPAAAAAKGACRIAARAPSSGREAPEPFVRSLLELGDRRAAGQAALDVAAALPAGAPKERVGRLTTLLVELDLCSAAERLAALQPRAREAEGAVRKCAQLRKAGLLPATVRLQPEVGEQEYVDLVQRGRAAMMSRKRGGDLRALAAAVTARFPDAPGGPFLTCLADLDGATAERLRADCEAAEKAAPQAFEPSYALGLVAGHEGRWPEARDHLHRALEREERDGSLWERLAHAMVMAGDTAGLAKLEERYRRRAGRKLAARW